MDGDFLGLWKGFRRFYLLFHSVVFAPVFESGESPHAGRYRPNLPLNAVTVRMPDTVRN